MKNERLNLFDHLMKCKLSEDERFRSLLALMFTNENFGADGICIRNELSREGINSLSADLYFTYPLKLYNILTVLGMNNFVKSYEKSDTINDFYCNLNIFGKALVYSHLIGIMEFLIYPVDSIPNVKNEIIKEGFMTLRHNMCSLVSYFRPDNFKESNLKFYVPDLVNFEGIYKMGWYLCITDIIWTIPLFTGIKSCFSKKSFIPMYLIFIIAEKLTQVFFNIYLRSMEKISIKRMLKKDEYIVLNMICGLDYKCYSNFIDYHEKSCSSLNKEFFDEMRIFCKNVFEISNITRKHKIKHSGEINEA